MIASTKNLFLPSDRGRDVVSDHESEFGPLFRPEEILHGYISLLKDCCQSGDKTPPYQARALEAPVRLKEAGCPDREQLLSILEELGV